MGIVGLLRIFLSLYYIIYWACNGYSGSVMDIVGLKWVLWSVTD